MFVSPCIVAFLLAFISVGESVPVERGACVVMCSPGVGVFDDLKLSSCPKGQECRATGCGAMCQPVTTYCRPVLCEIYCPHGRLQDENGCDQCSCQPTLPVMNLTAISGNV